MADAKHTSGPWSFSPQKGKPGHCHMAQVWNSAGDALAQIEPTPDEAVATADARLIAASPTLLEALKEAHAALKAYENAHDQDAGSWSLGGLHEAEERGCLAVLNSEAAIAKAEGEV